MLDSTHSRGEKQRIKQKISLLKKQPKPSLDSLATSTGQLIAKPAAPAKQVQESAKDRVEALLKKREVKKDRKINEKQVKQSEEDKKMMR